MTLRTLTAAATLLAAATLTAGRYTVTMPASEADQGTMAVLIDYGHSTPLDSMIVKGDKITFTGDIDGSTMGRIKVNDKRRAQFVIEPGTIVIDEQGDAAGTPLNAVITDYDTRLNALEGQYREAATDTARQRIVAEADALTQQLFQDHRADAVGAMLLMSMAYDMDLAAFDAMLDKAPALAAYAQINALRQSLLRRQQTSVGGKMLDFEIPYEGKTQRLSDHVGRGRWTLVDFWASWCGPCRREIPNLKQILADYGDKGLDVLGVAVWDKPEDTKLAMKNLGITWPVIIDAQSVPTDLYGISGIPTIILFDPEGRIVSRGLQGEELRAAVDKAMTGAK